MNTADRAYPRESFGVVCLACGSWRVHIGVHVERNAKGELDVAPVLTCVKCHARHVYNEQAQRTLVVR